jgi:hypothetical protein
MWVLHYYSVVEGIVNLAKHYELWPARDLLVVGFYKSSRYVVYREELVMDSLRSGQALSN